MEHQLKIVFDCYCRKEYFETQEGVGEDKLYVAASGKKIVSITLVKGNNTLYYRNPTIYENNVEVKDNALENIASVIAEEALNRGMYTLNSRTFQIVINVKLTVRK